MLEYPEPVVKTKYFHGGGTSYKLYVKNNKIYVPTALQYRTIKWYHDMLPSWSKKDGRNHRTLHMVAKNARTNQRFGQEV